MGGSGQHSIRLFQSLEHACGYWPERLARDLIIDPADPHLPSVYGQALAMGFRRSGGHVYRPYCGGCRACISVRIPVDRFEPGRSHKRCLARNADLELRIAPARRTDENFALYRRYLDTRHAGGGMDDPAPENFDAFLACRWSPTEFMEFRLGGELVALAVTDVLPQGLSAVYTFFEPALAERSLGTYAILQQVARARREQRGYVYLGFWLAGHPKMEYKRRFRPLEYLDGAHWRPMPDPAP
ncbi:MAG: arginyltransferase [Arenimonas sp. SCN 70-307]|uniref:arginyltransferase n=1 Tax=Arenimonas sp. SCN 70-307 TaxID=1660089 RepID=UPI000869B56D|nr:arginyltransferase [Arenimonas sp. SCN 70-307]ODS62516.1 MAG: arginyltransferase [Arenimonas sp. SCN 70-307]